MARLIRIAPWAHHADPEFSGITALAAAPVAELDQSLAVDTNLSNPDDHLASRKIEAHARADECRRLSRLLHDDIGQSLTALTVKLAVLRGQTSGAIQAQLVDAQRLLEQTLDQVQRLSKGLHPSAVEDLGLVPALQSHIQKFSQETAMSIRLKALNPQLSTLNSELAVAIFRSVEALLTDLCSAAPSETTLTLAVARNALQLEARAKLKGSATVPVAPPGVSPGEVVPDLKNFHERVLMAGGTVKCRTTRNHALITARFPMTNHGKV